VGKLPSLSSKGIMMRTVILTPDEAAEILKTKTSKDWTRKDAVVKELKAKIRKKEWIPDLDPIAIGNCQIRSGHHRLTAIAEGKVAVEVVIWDTHD
jgi:hypothetical protein